MKLIKPNVEIIEQQPGLEGIYKQIELAGRTCYKSEDKITEDSAKAFVDRMIKSGHGAMLEHGTVYLTIPITDSTSYRIDAYTRNKYTRSAISKDVRNYYITTNLRVLVENNWLNDLQYICEPTEYHEKRITVKWTCDRGVSHEFVRHRVFSFAMESTRYCNYSKDKFNNEITFIIPSWLNLPEGKYTNWDNDWCDVAELKLLHPEVDNLDDATNCFLQSIKNSEYYYFMLLDRDWKPQQARQVLPNALKTELVMTGFESDWKGFFKLRSPKYGATGVHPDAAYLADKLYDLLYIDKGCSITMIHHDAFDGECSYLKDGDMITYHYDYDKNKDVCNINNITIKPKDKDEYTLSLVEYMSSRFVSSSALTSYRPALLNLKDGIISEIKNIEDDLTIAVGDNTYCINKEDYEKQKAFREEKEKEFGSKGTNIPR